MKILYVEHDDDNLYMLKTRLERCGDFEVLAAEDSEQGCKLAVTEHPDVILIDLEMPVMDRWEPVRTLKKDARTRNIPIIGMSAYAEVSEREKAIATGCDEFDTKPIEFESVDYREARNVMLGGGRSNGRCILFNHIVGEREQ